jgi:hypothetical protein
MALLSITAGGRIHFAVGALAMTMNPDDVFRLATVGAAWALLSISFSFGNLLSPGWNGVFIVHIGVPCCQSSADSMIYVHLLFY